MYWIQITLVCCILAGTVYTLELTFSEPPPSAVTVGQEISMKCEVDEGAAFMTSKVLSFTHKNAKTQSEETISEQGNLVSGYREKGYSLEFSYDPVCSVKISIAAVTDEMDGEFKCLAKKSAGDTVLAEKTSQVTVLAGIESIEMTVENEKVDEEGKELSFREGMLTVGCVASGSNPQPVIHLTIDGEPLAADVTAMKDPDSTLARRSFKGSVTYQLDFNHKYFGKVLLCHAETELPAGASATLPDMGISAVLNGIVDEPVVSCTNNTASNNDRRITLKCLVSKEPKVKSMFYSVGNKHNIYPGHQAADLTECKKNDLNTTFDELVLQFYEMKEWHFTANIYLEVVGYDDTVYQYPVYLIKDTVGRSSQMSSCVVLLVASLIAVVSLIRSS